MQPLEFELDTIMGIGVKFPTKNLRFGLNLTYLGEM
jgi:hypothetical protein